uniref:Pheromone binding protein 2 n=1 Tax=Conopomorpha sinensis TaxID=940481 RepID=A0A2Z4EDS6_9NEOP|nr:pheromone binding protein 2 [Conopomorpha sinensis]
MTKMSGKLFVCLMVTLIGKTMGSSQAMKDITTGFTKGLDECKTELGLTEVVMKDLYNYWKEDYELLNRDVGCAIKCLSGKLNLLDPSGRLHHGNAADFAKAHGADDDVATKVVQIIHACEKPHDAIEDECTRVLEIAKCFRTEVHTLKWAPDMTVIIEEVLTEI